MCSLSNVFLSFRGEFVFSVGFQQKFKNLKSLYHLCKLKICYLLIEWLIGPKFDLVNPTLISFFLFWERLKNNPNDLSPNTQCVQLIFVTFAFPPTIEAAFAFAHLRHSFFPLVCYVYSLCTVCVHWSYFSTVCVWPMCRVYQARSKRELLPTHSFEARLNCHLIEQISNQISSYVRLFACSHTVLAERPKLYRWWKKKLFLVNKFGWTYSIVRESTEENLSADASNGFKLKFRSQYDLNISYNIV